jgi:hypothetical protein
MTDALVIKETKLKSVDKKECSNKSFDMCSVYPNPLLHTSKNVHSLNLSTPCPCSVPTFNEYSVCEQYRMNGLCPHCFGIVFYLPSISDTLDPPNQKLSLSSLPNLKRPVMNRVSPTVCQLLAYLTTGQNQLNLISPQKAKDWIVST